MLTFKVTSPSSFTIHDYDSEVVKYQLAGLPKAAYSPCSDNTPFIISRDAAERILKVTHMEDHVGILEEIIAWNAATYGDQVLMSKYRSDFCCISHSKTFPKGFMAVTIHGMSETKSVYLTIKHDSDLVMMDIQL